MPISGIGYSPVVSKINFGQDGVKEAKESKEASGSKSMLVYGGVGALGGAAVGALGGHCFNSPDKDSATFSQKFMNNSLSDYDAVIAELNKGLSNGKPELTSTQKELLKVFEGVEELPKGKKLKELIQTMNEHKAYISGNAEDIKTSLGAERVAKLADLLQLDAETPTLKTENCDMAKFTADNKEVLEGINLKKTGLSIGLPEAKEIASRIDNERKNLEAAVDEGYKVFNENFEKGKTDFAKQCQEKMKSIKEDAGEGASDIAKKITATISDMKSSTRNKWAIYTGILLGAAGAAYAYFSSPSSTES